MSDVLTWLREQAQVYDEVGEPGAFEYGCQFNDAANKLEQLQAENARLKDALQEIASQGRPFEYDDEQKEMADYETGYDMCILTAREALSNDAQKELL